jgi:hypothetical protein
VSPAAPMHPPKDLGNARHEDHECKCGARDPEKLLKTPARSPFDA